MSYKQLINFDNYYIYEDGRIYSLNVKRFLKPKNSIDKYLQIGLSDNNKKRKFFCVHRLVYEAFNGPIPEGLQVDHINGIRDDNRLENLRLLTHKENNQIKHHLDQYKEIEKQKYMKNKDKKREYREKNKEKIKEKDKRYYEEHKEEKIRKSKEYYEKNKEKILKYHKEYREKNKDKIKEYYQKNKEEIRRKQRERKTA